MARKYIDIRYPGMKPLICIYEEHEGTLEKYCVVKVGKVYLYPLFYHAGEVSPEVGMSMHQCQW